MAKKDDHIRIKNTPTGSYQMFCQHCGEQYEPALPCSMDMMAAMMKEFLKQHKVCKKDLNLEAVD